MGIGLLSGLRTLAPWHYALKRIGGQFGSSVLSYFLFLKTLLAFNVLLLLPLLAFVVGVQAAFPPAPPGPVPVFTGLELLTGGVRAWWDGAPPCPSLPWGDPTLTWPSDSWWATVSSPCRPMSVGPGKTQTAATSCLPRVVLAGPALALPLEA